MGLIMLILVGTVPTAYALNHTRSVSADEMQTVCCRCPPRSPGQSGADVDDPPLSVPADSRAAELPTRFVSTKKYEPGVMLALQQMADIDGLATASQVKEYGSFSATFPRN